jgi:hypothetical protein
VDRSVHHYNSNRTGRARVLLFLMGVFDISLARRFGDRIMGDITNITCFLIRSCFPGVYGEEIWAFQYTAASIEFVIPSFYNLNSSSWFHSNSNLSQTKETLDTLHYANYAALPKSPSLIPKIRRHQPSPTPPISRLRRTNHPTRRL